MPIAAMPISPRASIKRATFCSASRAQAYQRGGDDATPQEPVAASARTPREGAWRRGSLLTPERSEIALRQDPLHFCSTSLRRGTV